MVRRDRQLAAYADAAGVRQPIVARSARRLAVVAQHQFPDAHSLADVLRRW